MTDPHLFDRERRLVAAFRALLTWRESTQRDIEQAWEAASSSAASERDQAIQQAERRFASDSEGIEHEAQSSLTRIEESLQPEIERLCSAYKAARSDAEEHHTAKLEATRKERDESIWLAETIYDSDESQSRKRHQNEIERLDAANRDITSALENTADAIEANRWSRWIDRDLRSVAASPPTAGPKSDDSVADHASLAQTVREVADQLVRNPALRASAPLAWWIGTGVLVAISAGLVLVLNNLQWTIYAIVVPVALLASSCAVWFALQTIGRKRLVADIDALTDAARSAMAHGAAARVQLDEQRAKETASLRNRRDKDMQRARDEHTKRVEQREQKNRSRLTELESDYAPKIRKLEDRIAEEREQVESRRATLSAQATQRRDTIAAEAEKAFEDATVHARAARDEGWQKLRDRWNKELPELVREAESVQALRSALIPAWKQNSDIAAWSPPNAMSPSPGAEIGVLRLDLASLPRAGRLPNDDQLPAPEGTHFELPVAIDLLGRGSLLIKAGSEARAGAFDLLRNAMLRLLTVLPPAKVRFTLIDPVGLGQNFAGFMHLADHLPALVGDRIWTEPRHIEQRLADLTEHMEQVIQKYLRNEYASLDAYNQKAGEIAEPFRFLVIADFPTNISDNAAQRLASIATSGARCGVHMLIFMDPDSEPPKNLDLADLQRNAVVIADHNGKFVVDDQELTDLPLVLDPPTPDEASTELLNRVGAAASDASRVEVPFEAIAPDPDKLWSRSAADDLRVPLGRSGATKLQELLLGRGTAQHALIAGKTGSGKSTLLHVLITNLAMWFSPSEVEFYLVDFKKGVEFKTYATHKLPHARVVAVETDREFGLSVLRRLDEELKQRAELFRAAGVQDLSGYRANTGEPMPRSLLIVDEFQELFTEDDRIAQDSALLLDRIVRQGRAFGVHVILGSQTLGGAYTLNRATMGQMNVRIALQCSEADSYLILSEDNAAARLLSRPGEAIYNDAGGLIEGNSPFQIVWLPETVRDQALNTVSLAARDRLPTHPESPIVFEGNAPADIRDNAPLRRLKAGEVERPPVPVAYLGEPISIRQPIGAAFRKQGGTNLLIVGQQDETATSLVASALVSLSLHCGTKSRFAIIDPTPSDSSLASTLRSIAESLPTPVSFADHATAESAIAQIHAELTVRQEDAASPQTPIFLFIHALHRVRSLRRSEDDFGFGSSSDPDAPPKPDRMLATILAEGPPLGIHTIAWADTLATVERCFDRSALREFEQRVLLQMSATDSASLIDSPAASRLGLQRAIFFTEESPDIERFRPYALLDPAIPAELLR